ncbi:MAG: type-F conjugative transfer system pilin assembly protein TrbC [Gammaproteobacteria bacterium]
MSLVKLILLFSIILAANAEKDCVNDPKEIIENIFIPTKEIEKKYLIFVSFSMPKSSLKSLYSDSKLNNGVLLIRGLKNGSFKETAAYLKSLGIGVEINPQAFKQYKIDKVPTILLLENEQFKSISGNVSLSYAKELLEAS